VSILPPIDLSPLSQRRYAILFSLALLITLAPAGACGQNVDTLRLLHTSDTHVVYHLDQYNAVLASTHEINNGKTDSLEKFLQTMPRQLGADAVVITGDIIDV
jgi:hypothetical protein